MAAKRHLEYSFGLGKRGPDFSFGLGKRRNDFSFGLGKRAPDYSFGLGKRAPDYSFGLGKRGGPRDFSFGLGKRAKDFSFGLGKRSVGTYSFGLGKREVGSSQANEYSADEVIHGIPLQDKKSKQFSFGLGKRSVLEVKSGSTDTKSDPEDRQNSRHKREVSYETLVDYDDLGSNDLDNEFYADKRKNLYQFGLGKRSEPMYYIPYPQFKNQQEEPESITDDYLHKRTPDRFSFGLGKRSRSYEFGLGKRDRNSQDDESNLRSSAPVDNQSGYSGLPFRRSFNFGLGKRSRAATIAELMKKNIKDFSFGLGKRSSQKSKPLQRSYDFGLGKRRDPTVQSLRPDMFGFGLGK